jgi:hypothetical protein
MLVIRERLYAHTVFPGDGSPRPAFSTVVSRPGFCFRAANSRLARGDMFHCYIHNLCGFGNYEITSHVILFVSEAHVFGLLYLIFFVERTLLHDMFERTVITVRYIY